VKRNEFVKYLSSHNCQLFREGKKHPIFINNTNGKKTTVPRHSELDDWLCVKICQQLEIPKIK
jgi:hypothetical protein